MTCTTTCTRPDPDPFLLWLGREISWIRERDLNHDCGLRTCGGTWQRGGQGRFTRVTNMSPGGLLYN